MTSSLTVYFHPAPIFLYRYKFACHIAGKTLISCHNPSTSRKGLSTPRLSLRSAGVLNLQTKITNCFALFVFYAALPPVSKILAVHRILISLFDNGCRHRQRTRPDKNPAISFFHNTTFTGTLGMKHCQQVTLICRRIFLPSTPSGIPRGPTIAS